jgi:copper chaperone
MEKFNVPDMSCGHCTAAIEDSVLDADEGAEVICDLDTHTVTVNSVLDPGAIRAAIKAAGFEASPA